MGLDLLPESPRRQPDIASSPALTTNTPTAPEPAGAAALRDIDRNLTAITGAVYGDDAVGARQRIDAAVERDGPGAYARISENPGAFGAVVDPSRSRQLADGLRERSAFQAYVSGATPQTRQVEVAPLRINPDVEVPASVVRDLADRTPTFELEGPKGKATVTLPATTGRSLDFLVRAGYSQQGAISAREQASARFGAETPRTYQDARTDGTTRTTTDSVGTSAGVAVGKDGPAVNAGIT